MIWHTRSQQASSEDHYGRIGAIFQHFAHCDLTARENVGFGDVTALEDADRIHRAAHLGGAAGMIGRLPRRFDTMLGKHQEGSTNLSGGEWHRLALACAFIRDASLLVLDEPTAALAACAEREVYRRFVHFTAGKTALLITQRLRPWVWPRRSRC